VRKYTKLFLTTVGGVAGCETAVKIVM